MSKQEMLICLFCSYPGINTIILLLNFKKKSPFEQQTDYSHEGAVKNNFQITLKERQLYRNSQEYKFWGPIPKHHQTTFSRDTACTLGYCSTVCHFLLQLPFEFWNISY